MPNMPIVEGLKKYISEGVISLHMPGHKNNIKEFEELNWLQENLYKIDNTEVKGLDNLHLPEEMILEAELLTATAFKAAKSFLLVNGSTCGVYSMILGVTKPGDKVIVQRNCHKSVFTACLLGDLRLEYINPWISEEFSIPLSVKEDEVIEIMNRNPEAKAIVITYPTFYGTCMDLGRIVREAHSRNILVLVDEAHGAHGYFNQKLPRGAMEYGADAAVTSFHKTTPALTQTAVLNVGSINTEGIEFMLRTFQSTSPSYVFMASMDIARGIMEDRGEKLIDELLEDIEAFKIDMAKLTFYKILDKEHIAKQGFTIDPTKLVIKSPLGGTKLDSILREKYGLQVEMSDANNVVALTTIGNKGENFKKLYKALSEISYENKDNKFNKIEFNVPGYREGITMREAYYSKKEKMKIHAAVGKISTEMATPYPPGIPILLPGEIITEEIVEAIDFYKQIGIPINGLMDKAADNIYTAIL